MVKKLNTSIWINEKEFLYFSEIFKKMPEKRRRFFPVFIEDSKWHSLHSIWRAGKIDEYREFCFSGKFKKQLKLC